jgi:hypothetical protein
MADLAVAPYRGGRAQLKKGFDVGAGPSRDVEDAIRSLETLVEDGDLDAALVRRVAWMSDWEEIVVGAEPRKHWARKEDGDTTTVVCAPKELERILSAMKVLRPHVRKSALASWDELISFLRACAKAGGTVCLWYSPTG